MSYITRLGTFLTLFAIVAAPSFAFAADPSATIDVATLTTAKTKPTITGTATSTKAVYVLVRAESGKTVFKKSVRVKDDVWRLRISKRLKEGEYEVFVYAGKRKHGDALVEGTLVVDKDKKASSASGKGTTLSLSAVPLLIGGTARAGTSVPVAYIKVVNTSTKPSALDGFTLTQNGTAPVSLITTFSTSDDKGGSRATVPATFKGTVAFVPLSATLAPGQMRIFTIKAGLGTNVSSFIWSTLKLDVASVATGASALGTFPIRGTTWTVGY